MSLRGGLERQLWIISVYWLRYYSMDACLIVRSMERDFVSKGLMRWRVEDRCRSGMVVATWRISMCRRAGQHARRLRAYLDGAVLGHCFVELVSENKARGLKTYQSHFLSRLQLLDAQRGVHGNLTRSADGCLASPLSGPVCTRPPCGTVRCMCIAASARCHTPGGAEMLPGIVECLLLMTMLCAMSACGDIDLFR